MTTLATALELQDLSAEVHDRELHMAASLPCQVAAPVQGIPHDSRTSRFVGAEAVQHAQLSEWLKDNTRRQERAGACVGSGMSGVREIVEAARTVYESGLRRLSPYFVPKVLANSTAG